MDLRELLGSVGEADLSKSRIEEGDVWNTEGGSDMSGHSDVGEPAGMSAALPAAGTPTDKVAMMQAMIEEGGLGYVFKTVTEVISAREEHMKKETDGQSVEMTLKEMKEQGELYDGEDVGLLVTLAMTKCAELQKVNDRLASSVENLRAERDQWKVKAHAAESVAKEAETRVSAAEREVADKKRKAELELPEQVAKVLRQMADKVAGGQ
jgi:outer membrane murein-binding lipoprotein Lpp